jgi:hypothetical protein
MPQKLVTLVLTVTLVWALETPGRANRAAAAVAAAVIIKVRIFASGIFDFSRTQVAVSAAWTCGYSPQSRHLNPAPGANIPKVDTHLELVNFD